MSNLHSSFWERGQPLPPTPQGTLVETLNIPEDILPCGGGQGLFSQLVFLQ